MEWISVKKCLPLNGSMVYVKISILFKSKKRCLFIAGLFVSRGENITTWVTHWMPLREPPK